MKSSNTRQPLHQQSVPEQKGPFFNKGNDDAKKKDDVFFQTKLAVGEKGDRFEQEADKVADKVQKKAEEKEKPDVQKKGEDKDKETDKGAAGPAITAKDPKSAAGPASAVTKDKAPADKGLAGNAKHGKDPAKEQAAAPTAAPAAAEHKDKAPDPKSAAGMAPHAPKDKLPGQSAGGQMNPKDEETKMINRKEAEKDKEPDVQKMSKDKEEQPVQKMSDGDKKEDDKTKVNKKEEAGKEEKEKPVTVMKEEAPKPPPVPVHPGAHKVSLEERIKKSKGKGQSLPEGTKAFLEAEMGADLSNVVIHTDGEAIAINKELNARAFTSGRDIYFNAGQYNPETAEGRRLLAHELTHVVQQTGASKKKDKK